MVPLISINAFDHSYMSTMSIGKLVLIEPKMKSHTGLTSLAIYVI